MWTRRVDPRPETAQPISGSLPWARARELVLLFGIPLGWRHGQDQRGVLEWVLACPFDAEFSESARVWMEWEPRSLGAHTLTAWGTSDRVCRAFASHLTSALDRMRQGVTLVGRTEVAPDHDYRLNFASDVYIAYEQTRAWPDSVARARYWWRELPAGPERRWMAVALALGWYVWVPDGDDCIRIAAPTAVTHTTRDLVGKVPVSCSGCGDMIHPSVTPVRDWLCARCESKQPTPFQRVCRVRSIQSQGVFVDLVRDAELN